MAEEPVKSTIYLSYSAHDFDFAFQLAADLKNAGFDLWLEQFDLTAPDTHLPTLQYSLERCALALLVFSADDPQVRELWGDIQQMSEAVETSIVPILVRTWAPDGWPSQMGAVDFTGWRNEVIYYEKLEALTADLHERFPDHQERIPGAETRYVNHVVATIKRYRALLSTISPRSNALPSDKRAIYAQSMWGLTGAFEVVSEDDRQTLRTYQFHELAADYPRFVLTGASGVGKTTTLYRALLDALRSYQASPNQAPIPLLLHLGQWYSDTDFVTFLQSCWPLEDDPLPLLAEGKITLFIDGLDELAPGQSARIEDLRSWLHGDYAPQQVVIACDDLLWSGHDLGLPLITLKEINAARIRQYVINHLPAEAAESLLQQIIREEDTSDTTQVNRAHRLARNALFLAIMISIMQKSADEIIPTHRAHLLEHLAQALWQQEMHPHLISFEYALPHLSRLAFAMIDEDMPAYVPYDYARQHIGDTAILQKALDGNLFIMERGLLSFSHRWLRDYFATYRLMAEEGLYTRLMRAQFTPEGDRLPWKWDRTVYLCCALAGDPGKAVSEIAEVNPYLALECIASGIEISEQVQEEVVEHLLEFTRTIDPAYLSKIIRVLQNNVDVDAISTLLEHLHSDPEQQSLAQETDEVTNMPLKKLGTDTIRFLMDILRGEKWQRRRGAAWALGELREPAAIPSLVEALRDDNDDVRREAAYSLVRIGRPALPRLLKSLYHNDPDMRAAAIKVLGKMRDASAVPDLIACLPDTEWPRMEEVRICDLAAVALEHIGTDEALAALDTWRQGSRPSRQSTSWNARIRSGQPAPSRQKKTAEELLAELQSDDWAVRRDAVSKLGNLSDESLLPHLIQALNDEDSQVRWTAVKALDGFEGDEVINALLGALRDRDFLVCDAAAATLIPFGQAAVPGLIYALKDNSPDVRGAAAEALGKIGDESAIPHLVDILEDQRIPHCEEVRVCDIAAGALDRIGSEKALFALGQWRRDQEAAGALPLPDMETPLLQLDEVARHSEESNPHRTALIKFLDALQTGTWHDQQEAAGALRDYARSLQGDHNVEAIEKLTAALENKKTLVRWSAAEALAWIGDTAAAPALMEALNDESWAVRIAAIRALFELDSEAAVPGLLNALQDERNQVREAAVETLGKVGDPELNPHLTSRLAAVMLGDQDSFVRRAAVVALGQLGDPSVIPDVISALQSDDSVVRWAALETLGKFDDPGTVSTLAEYLSDTSRPDWEDRRLCDVAAEALERIGTDEALDALNQWRTGTYSK
jgi:HEAT repeat protein